MPVIDAYQHGTVVKKTATGHGLVEFDVAEPVWGRCFTVAPLVLVGSRDADGSLDLAPKHMATPMGWQNYFGFVCSPDHHTHTNIERTQEFTVSYPKPSQVLFASLAASPRYTEGPKTVLQSYDTFSASRIDGEFITDAYLFFECRHFKTVDGFGNNCLITGEIVAAYADPAFVRGSEHDDQELIHDAPLFAFLPPGRFATISRSNAFPFPVDMKR
jgi:flavin reductase (DIM6/NTAB) family NADH-FMN oxidoreductase RutF